MLAPEDVTIGILAIGNNDIDRPAQLWVREQVRQHFNQLLPKLIISRLTSKCERWCIEEALKLNIPTQLIMPQKQQNKLSISKRKLTDNCKWLIPSPSTPPSAAKTLVTLSDILICIAAHEHNNTYINLAQKLGCNIIWINW